MNAEPNPLNAARPTGTFYGWWIVSAVFVAQAISSGLATYSFGLFQLPIAEEFGVSRSVVSFGMLGSMLLAAILGPIMGRALDRGSVRRLMLLAGAVMAGCYLALAYVGSIALLGLFFVVGTAAGQMGLGPCPLRSSLRRGSRVCGDAHWASAPSAPRQAGCSPRPCSPPRWRLGAGAARLSPHRQHWPSSHYR